MMCVQTQHPSLQDRFLKVRPQTALLRWRIDHVWVRMSVCSDDRTMRKSLIQVFGFLFSTLGWLFVSCTLAMNYWRVIFVGGKGGSWMIKSSWYWSNLWRDCVTDTSSVTNCRDYDVLWAVTRKSPLMRVDSWERLSYLTSCASWIAYVQGVRGLLMVGMSLGFVAAVLCFIGMDCTYIGGSGKTKDKVLFSGAAFHFVGGEQNHLSNIYAFNLYVPTQNVFGHLTCIYAVKWGSKTLNSSITWMIKNQHGSS